MSYYYNNNNRRQEAYEKTQLSQLKISFIGNIAEKIIGKWKSVARYMNIEPEKSVIPYCSSCNIIDLSNKMLTVAAALNKTVGDLNDALRDMGLNTYMLKESDVNSNLIPPH